jgi:hypothetical protein
VGVGVRKGVGKGALLDDIMSVNAYKDSVRMEGMHAICR